MLIKGYLHAVVSLLSKCSVIGDLNQDFQPVQQWDKCDLEKLLVLSGGEQAGDGSGGFRFRHYWFPATELTYQSEAIFYERKGVVCRLRQETKKRIVSCRSDLCVWSENGQDETGTSELSCRYDFSNQTFRYTGNREFSILEDGTFGAEMTGNERQQALFGLAFVVPKGYVQIGSTWSSTVNQDCMNYCLESVCDFEKIKVLFIRREGEFTYRIPLDSQPGFFRSVKTVRRGLTAYLPDRSVVLEDRFLDTTIDSNDGSVVTSIVVCRLIRSE